MAFVDPNDLNNNLNNILENQFFYQPYCVAYSSRIIKHQSFCYGLSAGYTFKRDSRLVQLSYNNDVANFRAFSSFRPYNDPTYSGWGLNYYGTGLHRFMLNYSFKLTKKPSFVQSWFTFGLGTFINKNTWTGIFPWSWDMTLNPNGDMLLRTYLQPFKETQVNGVLKVGVENDLFVKGKYLFSINASYVQGLGTISRVEFVHEYILNGQFVHHGTGLMSRGSGFYWEITRKIQAFPKKIKGQQN